MEALIGILIVTIYAIGFGVVVFGLLWIAGVPQGLLAYRVMNRELKLEVAKQHRRAREAELKLARLRAELPHNNSAPAQDA